MAETPEPRRCSCCGRKVDPGAFSHDDTRALSNEVSNTAAPMFAMADKLTAGESITEAEWDAAKQESDAAHARMLALVDAKRREVQG